MRISIGGNPNLALIREEIGLTQQQVADLLDVHVQSVSNWERGAAPIPSKHREKLSTILQVPTITIMYADLRRLMSKRYSREQIPLLVRYLHTEIFDDQN